MLGTWALRECLQAIPDRTIIDMDGLRVAMEYGQKCRKVDSMGSDGLGCFGNSCAGDVGAYRKTRVWDPKAPGQGSDLGLGTVPRFEL